MHIILHTEIIVGLLVFDSNVIKLSVLCGVKSVL